MATPAARFAGIFARQIDLVRGFSKRESIAGRIGPIGRAPYAAAKWGVEGFRRVWSKRIEKITSSGAQTVFNTIVPPGLTPFLEQLYNSGFTKRGGYLVCTYFDENFLAVRVQACTEV
jgi:NAD(P)-dependent dehydrogenase (short-subunit alcohol dehydrogenase family)